MPLNYALQNDKFKLNLIKFINFVIKREKSSKAFSEIWQL